MRPPVRLPWRCAATASCLVAALLVAGCGLGAPEPTVLDDVAALDAAGVTRLGVQVLGTTGHDPTAFTEGFELAGGSLWESTGLSGHSQLRELDPASGTVRRSVALPDDAFGEGVTVLPDRIWQLTYRDGVAYDRDPATLAVRRTVSLEREGWGACHDTERVLTSDGTDELVARDPVSFTPRGAVRVTAAGVPVDELNELECTPAGVWANVWRTDHIVRIDPTSGRVTAVVDASGLLPPGERGDTDVLNGIAAVPGTDEFLLTGKLWPTTFRVRFVRR